MKNDRQGGWKWTALLPDGRRVRLNVAEGVRLCVGDVLSIGGTLYNVVKRGMDAEEPGWCVVVREGSGVPPERRKVPRESGAARFRGDAPAFRM